MKRSTILVCLLALFPTLFARAFFPSLNLFFLAPLIVLFYYRTSFIGSLWISIACGILIDLLATDGRMGVTALSYCATTVFLYQRKKQFFEEKLSTLPVMTALFSLLATLVQTALMIVLGSSSPLSAGWFFTDLMIMPVADGLYALIWFTLPLLLLRHKPAQSAAYRSDRPQ